MEFAQAFLQGILSRYPMEVTFPNLPPDFEAICHDICLAALRQIHMILTNDAYTDAQCFQQIEEIVLTLESIGIDCSPRHDFG